MHTDAKRLQQILKNLLSNAFKFTEQGRRLRCADVAANMAADGLLGLERPDNPCSTARIAAPRIAFSVTDTGIGIPPEKQRSSSRRSSRPTARPAASTAAPAWAWRSAASSPAPARRRDPVLIVDDDIRNIYSLTSVLESHEVEVLHAERGRDGILILEQTPAIDVALIDIMMPEMDGYETMQQIRQRPALASLPLIAVTAKAMKGDRQKCLDAGASDYIAKPVDIELLLALLRVWIGKARSRGAAPMIEPLVVQTAAE
jgi:CheY-like chemotaxis protein